MSTNTSVAKKKKKKKKSAEQIHNKSTGEPVRNKGNFNM
jgi:hypothetical protein